MDIEKLVQWSVEYLSDYFGIFIATLRKPVARFQPITPVFETSDMFSTLSQLESQIGPKLNPKLFGFMIISILIGATLNSIVIQQSSSTDFVKTSIVTLSFWFLYSVSIYGVCKMLDGKGNLVETLSVSLQLLAVIYVVSNLAVFFWGLLSPNKMKYYQNSFYSFKMESLLLTYYLIQFLLMLIYLPIGLKNVHGFKTRSSLIMVIVPIFWTLVIFFILTKGAINQIDAPRIMMTPPPTPIRMTPTATP